jgi:hypothetical protein
MSCSALREAVGIRKLCLGCGARKALFQYRGVVRSDRDHNLCFECYRSERDRQRSRVLLRSLPLPPLPISPSNAQSQ